MTNFHLHTRAERAFLDWGHLMVRWRWSVLFLSLLCAVVLICGFPRMRVDFSNESFLDTHDETRRRYDAFLERYGPDQLMLVGIKPAEVFDLEFLEKLRAFHADLERELPHVVEITSLVNARFTYGEGDKLVVGELMEDWPSNEAELAILSERALSNSFYVNHIVSRNHQFTAVMLRLETYSSLGEATAIEELASFEENDLEGAAGTPVLLTNEETWETIDALKAVVSRYENESFPVYLAGNQLIMHHIQELTKHDVRLFTGISICLVFVLLFALFRRLSAALLPLIVVTLSILATFGAMGWMGIPFTMPTQSVPTFLLAVGVCDAVHILSLFYRRQAAGEEKGEAIAQAMAHSGLAVVLTSLTTAGGLASFHAAELMPLAQLGTISPIGVLLALFFTLTLLPALLAIAPSGSPITGPSLFRKREATSGTHESSGEIGAIDATLRGLGNLAIGHPKAILFCTSVLLALGALGITQVRFSDSALEGFFEDDPVRIAIKTMDREFEGLQTLEILIDTGHENGLHDPDVLRRIDEATAHVLSQREGLVRIGKATSILDIVKETHRALNENRDEYYALPEDRALIAQELLLFENSGSDDLEQLTDSQLQTARLTLQSNFADGRYYVPFLTSLRSELQRILGPDIHFQITGSMQLIARSFSLLLTSLTRSYALAFAIITPLMILLVGNWKRGLLSMIPNLLPVYLTLGLMGALDIPITIMTVIIGSIILGIAVDDTIHFMHKFNQYYEASGQVQASIRKTFATTGVALLTTTVALATSFFVLAFASFYHVVQFGLLASSATIIAFLADMLVAPALLVMVLDDKQPEID